MRIQDLLIETNLEEQQLDELGFAQGLNKVSTGVGKAVGGVQGAYRGAKQAFNTARQATAQNVQQAVAGAGSTQTAPAATSPSLADPAPEPEANTTAVNPGIATSDDQSAQANQTTTNVAAAGARIGGPAGKQAVDNAIKTVTAVRADRRQGVIDYAQDKLDKAEQDLLAIRRNAGIQQQAQPNLQVQQGGRA